MYEQWKGKDIEDLVKEYKERENEICILQGNITDNFNKFLLLKNISEKEKMEKLINNLNTEKRGLQIVSNALKSYIILQDATYKYKI